MMKLNALHIYIKIKTKTNKIYSQEVKLFSFAPIQQNEEKESPIHDLKVIVTVGECDSPVFIEESRRYSKVKLIKYLKYRFTI